MKTPVRSRKHHSGSPLFAKKKEETPFGAVAKKLTQECTDMPELSANHEDFGPVPKLNFDSQNYLTGNYRKLILKRDVSSGSTNVINQTVTTSTTSLTSSPGNNATTEFLVPTTMAYQFIETPGMKDFTRSADSTDGVSETASNESCDREVPCNMGDTLEEILQAVDEIAHEKSSKTAHEDFPCDVNGSWVTEAGGVRLDIYVGNNSQLRIAQYETIPLKTHPGFLCNDTWVLNGSLPLSNSGIIMITGVNAHDKRVATFVGECHTVPRNKQMYWGHWIISGPSELGVKCVLSQQIMLDVIVKMKKPLFKGRRKGGKSKKINSARRKKTTTTTCETPPVYESDEAGESEALPACEPIEMELLGIVPPETEVITTTTSTTCKTDSTSSSTQATTTTTTSTVTTTSTIPTSSSTATTSTSAYTTPTTSTTLSTATMSSENTLPTPITPIMTNSSTTLSTATMSSENVLPTPITPIMTNSCTCTTTVIDVFKGTPSMGFTTTFPTHALTAPTSLRPEMNNVYGENMDQIKTLIVPTSASPTSLPPIITMTEAIRLNGAFSINMEQCIKDYMNKLNFGEVTDGGTVHHSEECTCPTGNLIAAAPYAPPTLPTSHTQTALSAFALNASFVPFGLTDLTTTCAPPTTVCVTPNSTTKRYGACNEDFPLLLKRQHQPTANHT